MTCKTFTVVVAALGLSASVAAQAPATADIARYIRSSDPDTRLFALQAARGLPPAEVPPTVAPLLADPVDRLQLEALDAVLASYLTRDIPLRRRVALVVEVRGGSRAAAAFAAGALAVLPRPVPTEVVSGLLAAMQDDNRSVRTDATYVAATILRPPVAKRVADQLLESLGHPDPVVREVSARALGRLRVTAAGEALVNAINDQDEQARLGAMRALGELREERAVQALEEQLAFHDRGRQAEAALDALARIAHRTSVPTFKTRMKDRDPLLRRSAAEGLGRAGDKRAAVDLELTFGAERDDRVSLAMAYALQRLQRPYLDRLVNALTRADQASADQIAEYLIELGPSVAPSLVSYLRDSEPRIRALVADVMGVIAAPQAAASLEALRQDGDREVARAAARALERLKYRQAS